MWGIPLDAVVAMLVDLVDPSVVVIGGSLASAPEHLLAGILEVVYQRSLPLATEQLQLLPSAAGERAGLLGAAALAIGRALSPESIESAANGSGSVQAQEVV